MFDDLLDIFDRDRGDRDRRRGQKRPGGLRGLIARLSDHDDDRRHDARRYDDDRRYDDRRDDDRRYAERRDDERRYDDRRYANGQRRRDSDDWDD